MKREKKSFYIWNTFFDPTGGNRTGSMELKFKGIAQEDVPLIQQEIIKALETLGFINTEE